jgi:hypothetical protein
MQRRGFLHSAIPAPQNFILGMCAPAELETVREALSERVIKGHLVDIVDDAAAGEGQRSEKALGRGGALSTVLTKRRWGGAGWGARRPGRARWTCAGSRRSEAM